MVSVILHPVIDSGLHPLPAGISLNAAIMHNLFNATENAFNGPHSYLVGGIIAFLIMGYLIYSLVRPEKF
jgi:K+-transporting ATPase KdpF subunit